MASTIEVDQIKHSSGVAFTLPTADGSAGHLLKTDGSRGLSFVADSSGIDVRLLFFLSMHMPGKTVLLQALAF